MGTIYWTSSRVGGYRRSACRGKFELQVLASVPLEPTGGYLIGTTPHRVQCCNKSISYETHHVSAAEYKRGNPPKALISSQFFLPSPMNVAGPSRRTLPPGRLAPGERVKSTYEQDLLGLLTQLSLDEMDEIQTFFTRRTGAGEPLSDHDIAMNDLLQQARALSVFDQDRMLAQRIAAGEEVGVELHGPAVQTPRVVVQVPRPNGHG